MSADWNKIKTEYITTGISYRDLALKYGVNRATVGKRAKEEKWVELRRQHADKTQTKILEVIEDKKVDRAKRLQDVADKLLGKVERILDESEPVEMDTQSLRHISATLKDIKEIQMIRSDADRREQEARIANLNRQAQKDDDKNSTITVVLEGALKDYAQ